MPSVLIWIWNASRLESFDGNEQAHFEKIALYGKLRSEIPKSFRNGMMLAQVGPITAITNLTKSATYTKLVDAVYLASTGDEINPSGWVRSEQWIVCVQVLALRSTRQLGLWLHEQQ